MSSRGVEWIRCARDSGHSNEKPGQMYNLHNKILTNKTPLNYNFNVKQLKFVGHM